MKKKISTMLVRLFFGKPVKGEKLSEPIIKTTNCSGLTNFGDWCKEFNITIHSLNRLSS